MERDHGHPYLYYAKCTTVHSDIVSSLETYLEKKLFCYIGCKMVEHPIDERKAVEALRPLGKLRREIQLVS